MPRRDVLDPAEFWSHVRKDPDGCWVWTAARSAQGYGVLEVGGRQQKAHRLSLELALGHPVPSDRWVCHHCDNRPCVRPDHLYVGTPTDNNRDTIRRGRRKDTHATHCKRGHALTPDNEWPTYANGAISGRRCKACKQMHNRESARRNGRKWYLTARARGTA